MEPQHFVKCLMGGVALGGATSLFFSDYTHRTTNKPYYNGLFIYEDDETIHHTSRRNSGNMPPSYLGDTNVKLERPKALHICEYDKMREYFE